METPDKAKLEQALDVWLTNLCESDKPPLGYIHDTLTREMATAVEAVYDASMNGQQFALIEQGEE